MYKQGASGLSPGSTEPWEMQEKKLAIKSGNKKDVLVWVQSFFIVHWALTSLL